MITTVNARVSFHIGLASSKCHRLPLLFATFAAVLGWCEMAGAWERVPPGSDAWGRSGRAAIRGVTIGPIESSQQPGRGYGTEYSERLLAHLQSMGVNWVSLTPYGRLESEQSTVIQMDFEAPYEENRAAVKRMIAQAHAHGMKVLVVPNLFIDDGGFVQDIDAGSLERRETFRRAYREFYLAWARDVADAGADAFSIGVERGNWSSAGGAWWREYIDDIRAVFPGLLTYSANWDRDAQDVVFWDQLDLIGINAFYPLGPYQSSDVPYATYVERAREARDAVRELAHTLDMPVIFTELGFTSRVDGGVEPWLWPENIGRNIVFDENEQSRAYAAMFEAMLPERWFAGFFVWRYYANLDDISQEPVWAFSPHAKRAETLLESVFNVQWGADPEPWPWVIREEPPPIDTGMLPYARLFGLSRDANTGEEALSGRR